MKIPLKFRDEGPDVIELQNLLNRNGESVAVDGVFGNETLAAVQDFQSKHTDLDGNPLAADGVAGSLTLASLQANAGGGEASSSSSGSFAGFDLAAYPGDETMSAWLTGSPYKWVGYYLKSPFHQDSSFMGQRAKLVAMGWGLAVLYVGRQATSKPENLTRERGLSDGLDTIQKVQDEGFPENTIVYLDVEPMDVVLPGIKQYLKGWISRILASQFLPGIYCHIKNAQDLRATAMEEYAAADSSRPSPAFWVSGSGHFDPAGSLPSASGIPFAAIWQGRFNHTEEHGGFSRQIDVNVSSSANPSVMAPTFVAGGGV